MLSLSIISFLFAFSQLFLFSRFHISLFLFSLFFPCSHSLISLFISMTYLYKLEHTRKQLRRGKSANYWKRRLTSLAKPRRWRQPMQTSSCGGPTVLPRLGQQIPGNRLRIAMRLLCCIAPTTPSSPPTFSHSGACCSRCGTLGVTNGQQKNGLRLFPRIRLLYTKSLNAH